MLFSLAAIHKAQTQVGGWGSHDEIVRVRTGEGGFKPGENVRISTVYFPHFKDFLDKNQKSK